MHLVLHPIQARHEHRREGEIRIGRRIGEAHLDAASLRVADVGDAARGRTIARRISKIDRRLEPRHQALVGVGPRVGDRVERLGVLDDPADIVQREVR